MDINMPAMNGIEASLQIRASTAWGDKPIIAMTAAALSHEREAMLQAGFDDIIVKPMTADELFQILLRWLP
jgi:two-component system sensor histidine kinase/response regulator